MARHHVTIRSRHEGPLVATAWTPHPALFDGASVLPIEHVWAALDCPGGWSLGPEPVKTGTLWVRQHAPIVPGGRYVVLGWPAAGRRLAGKPKASYRLRSAGRPRRGSRSGPRGVGALY